MCITPDAQAGRSPSPQASPNVASQAEKWKYIGTREEGTLPGGDINESVDMEVFASATGLEGVRNLCSARDATYRDRSDAAAAGQATYSHSIIVLFNG